jgi:uncharacterized membrane protein YbhN (UPF0104 family)
VTLRLVKSANAADVEPVAREAGGSEHQSRRQRLRAAVRWFATGALLYWLAWSTNWRGVGPTLAGASATGLLTAAACYLASQIASVARWRLIVRAAGIQCTFTRLLAAYFEGMFVNLCLPTSIGGDVSKVLRVGGSREKTVTAATVVADRASGIVALAALLALGLGLRYTTSSLGIILPICIGLLVLLELAILVGRRITVSQRFATNDLLAKLTRKIPFVTAAPWLRIIGWALVVQGLNVSAVAAAANAIGANVSLSGLLIAAETASLAAALPLSVAGIGIREASLPLLLAADSVPRSTAVALGLTWSAIVLAVGLLGSIGHIVEQRRATRGAEPATESPTDAPRYKAAA